MQKNTQIEYRRVGDYLIPNLVFPPEEAKVRLGKWGIIYKDYLFKHKKVEFSVLLAKGKLYQHCADVEKQAKDMFDTLVGQMKESEGVTEQLKEQDRWEWIQRIGNIQQRASEIIYNELIYSQN